MQDKNTILDDLMEYLREKKLAIVITYFIAIAMFGVWLCQDFVSFDAEGLYSMANGMKWYQQWIALDRWAFVALKKLLGVGAINPFFSATMALTFFPASAVLWNYLIYLWNDKKEIFRYQSILFSLLYLTHPVWAFQFAYRNQMEVCTLVMAVLPFALIFFTQWLEQGGFGYFLIAAAGVVVAFSSYQSFLFVYGEAVVIYYMLYIYRSKMVESKKLLKSSVRTIGFTIVAFAGYVISSKLMCMVFHLDGAAQKSYLSDQFLWLTEAPQVCIRNIVEYMKISCLGSNGVFTCNFIVITILFLICALPHVVGKKGGRIWGLLCMLGVVVIPFLLEIVTAGNVVLRSQFAFVLALAFMALYAWGNIYQIAKTRLPRLGLQILVILSMLLLILPQVQVTSRLLYTDYKVATDDKELMEQIYYAAMDKGAKEGDALVLLGGKGNSVSETLMEYEVIGISYFEVTPIALTKPNEAMQAYGYQISAPTDEQVAYARSIQETLPCWPDADAVYVEDGLIIVRLS